MKHKLTGSLIISAAIFLCGCNAKTNSETSVNNNNRADSLLRLNGGYSSQVEFGKHLVTITGCADCHTSKKMTDKGPVNDESLMFSGAHEGAPLPDVKQPGVAATYDQTAWVGPWGKSFAANITSDSTGIGNWSENQFINCLKKGLYKGLDGSRPLMPPMPWQYYSQMSESEMKAIFAYLKTVKPIHNNVPVYVPPVAMAK